MPSPQFDARLRINQNASEWIAREPAHLDTLRAMLGRSPRPVHLIGEGMPYHVVQAGSEQRAAGSGGIVGSGQRAVGSEELKADGGQSAVGSEAELDDGVIVTPAELWRARASVTARVGAAMASRGEYADPMTLSPLYIRLPEAEEKWRAAQMTQETKE